MEKYKIIKTMGDGSFGVVFKAISPNNQIVAIKKFKSKYKDWEECLDLRQIKSLKKIDHPNIIKLKQVILSNNQLYLVFDFIQANLYQVYMRAHQSNRTLTELQIRSIFFKLLNAIAYLHKNNFFHRDLKPQNVLCHNNEVKICDFGLARQIRSKPPFTQYVSTRWYRAPQLLLHSGTYNSPVDIFALACIIIQLYMMAPLFPGANQIQTLNKIVELMGTPKKQQWPEGFKLASKMNYRFPQKKKKQLCDMIPDASPEVVQLLESMLSYNSKKRPSAFQILKHPYFQNVKMSEQTDSQNQTKFSFYQKNIIELPTNIKVENPKQMQMRRSQIKFGNSFTSSFHLSKQEKKQRQNFDSIINSNKKINESQKNQNFNQKIKDKYKFKKHQDQIEKKFDQMEEILLQLQQKQKSAKKQEKKQKRISSEMMADTDRQKGQFTPEGNKFKKQNKNDQIKFNGFIFGGLNGLASNSNLKNLIKYPPKY